jgi:acyl CoA:acetate/3-ketoacid CoA transferase beta subunit
VGPEDLGHRLRFRRRAATPAYQDKLPANAESSDVKAATLEAVFLGVMALAVIVGGRFLVVQIALFGGLSVSVLGALAIVLVYAFRRNYLAGGPLARVHATRDAAFLAAIAAAIAFVISPARWSLGATVVALEVAIVVELLSRFGPAPSGGRRNQ